MSFCKNIMTETRTNVHWWPTKDSVCLTIRQMMTRCELSKSTQLANLCPPYKCGVGVRGHGLVQTNVEARNTYPPTCVPAVRWSQQTNATPVNKSFQLTSSTKCTHIPSIGISKNMFNLSYFLGTYFTFSRQWCNSNPCYNSVRTPTSFHVSHAHITGTTSCQLTRNPS